MLLEKLEVQGFRNLQGGIRLENGLNILIGDNGQGKTNWLEAIYSLATTKSFKTARSQEAVTFGEQLALVQGSVRQSAGICHELRLAIAGATKTLSINGKKEPAQRYMQELNAVIFNSDELEIIRGMPEARRKFLDAAIVAIYPPYLQTINDYSKVIRQKNALLQQAADESLSIDRTRDRLQPWNEQLSLLSERIHRSRVRFVERLNEAFEHRLFGGERIGIRYVSALEGKGDLTEYTALINERLELRVQAELSAGYALIGTHRDDLEITLEGRDMRKFGSAGQQRSALLLLQLADIAVYFAQRSEYPLFLIDDIDAELDFNRIGQLLEYLDGKTQTIVTTSKESFIEKFGRDAAVSRVEKGVAKRL